ncbi:MAG TPA: hypothetical protein ENN45_01470, partial [Bacteroidetes bacterium]|nr:hypothetical protein [Bacteroidota bacterium]
MGDDGEKIAEEATSGGQETKEVEIKDVKETDSKEEKKSAEELRKIIKVNQEGKKAEKPDAAKVDLEGDGRENLEQKRAILQSIK